MKYTFDDLIIVPNNYSTVKSRDDIQLSGPLVITASMDVFDRAPGHSSFRSDVLNAMAGTDYGMHIVSRAHHMLNRIEAVDDNTLIEPSKNELFRIMRREINGMGGLAVSWGEFNKYRPILEQLDCFVSIDVANGAIIDVKTVNTWKGKRKLIVGNFGSPKLLAKGFDPEVVILKLGIGGGAACTTRTTTGIGYPQASLIREAREELGPDYMLIADGGINTPADFCKALALGADAVMMGRYFADSIEVANIQGLTSTEKIRYWGMASYRGKNSTNTTRLPSRYVEGADLEIEQSGKTIANKMDALIEGLRSSMSYVGATTIEEYQELAQFELVTNSVLRESGTRS